MKKRMRSQCTENFYLEEFECKDGSITPIEVWGNIQKLAEELQTLRDIIKKPIIIVSGWRSKEHNKAVQGSPKSQHLEGKAADIRVKGMTPDQIGRNIRVAIAMGKMKEGGVGIYDTFVHYDTRGVKARWDLRK